MYLVIYNWKPRRPHQNKKNQTPTPNREYKQWALIETWGLAGLKTLMEASTFPKGAATLTPTTGNSDVCVHLNDLCNFAESVGWTAAENWSSRYGQGEACPPLLCKWHYITSTSLFCLLLNTHSWKVGRVFKMRSRIIAVFFEQQLYALLLLRVQNSTSTTHYQRSWNTMGCAHGPENYLGAYCWKDLSITIILGRFTSGRQWTEFQ